ncbi:MAG: hypothetical protein Q4P32_04225 [Micrococcales bacterium]|nr:hypothetical protein [Micrococcales bacterium]
MAHDTRPARRPEPLSEPRSRPDTHDPAYQAWMILRAAFTIAPIVFGLDKFFGVLVNWDKYLSPTFASLSPMSVHTTMYVVGIIEIIAGIIVALHPRLGGYVVTVWLAGIILNLLVLSGYYDVALRDFGLLLAAVALQRLSVRFDMHPLAWPVAARH